MNKEYIKYIAGVCGILLIFLFVYPTLYKYDKLEQKYPVKINRITGEASILSSKGWISSEDYDRATDAMSVYKNEIASQISNDHERMKSEIITEIKDEIITQLQDEIASTKAEIEKYKQHELDPNTYFTLGDTKETVKKIMGSPDTINSDDYLKRDTWFYGGATVTFINGKVKEWSNYKNTLRIK